MDWPQIGPKSALELGKKLQKDKWYLFRAPTGGGGGSVFIENPWRGGVSLGLNVFFFRGRNSHQDKETLNKDKTATARNAPDAFLQRPK